jgi:hypothetical protein
MMALSLGEGSTPPAPPAGSFAGNSAELEFEVE